MPDGSPPVPDHPELRDAVRLLTSAPAPDAPYDAGTPATPLPAARTAAPQEDVADDEGTEEQPELDRERPRLREEALPRVRGLLLGLALGDTLGSARDALPDRGPLLAGAGARSACLTVEGIIRATGGLPSAVRNADGGWVALPGDEAPIRTTRATGAPYRPRRAARKRRFSSPPSPSPSPEPCTVRRRRPQGHGRSPPTRRRRTRPCCSTTA